MRRLERNWRLVGLDEWMRARVWFGTRTSLGPDGPDMVVPIGIFAEDDAKNFTIDRAKHYLVDEFDRDVRGKLHTLPAWSEWVGLLQEELRSEARGLTN